MSSHAVSASLNGDEVKALLDQTVAGFSVLQDGRFVYVNEGLCEIFGYGRAALLGMEPETLIHPEDRPTFRRNVALRLSGVEKSLRYTLRAVRQDGSPLAIDVHGARVLHGGRPAIASVIVNVTELAESEGRLQEIASLLTEGVYVADEHDRLTFINPAGAALLGYDARDLVGRKAHGTFHNRHPDGTPYPFQACPSRRAMVEGRVVKAPVEHFIGADGKWLPVALSAAPILHGGRCHGAVVAFHDITERLGYQKALEQSEARWRQLFNASNDSVFVHDPGSAAAPGRIIEVNDVACALLGYTRDELLAMSIADIDDPASIADGDSVEAQLREHGRALFERRHMAKDGRRIPVEINAQVFEMEGHEAIISVARDITERKRAEARIHHLAHHDILTDLPNRQLMTDRLRAGLEQAKRHRRALAVLFVDLDGFKQVNDVHGHDVGDELLKAAASRLLACVRRADTVCRLGGDEFVVILTETAGGNGAEKVAEKILSEIKKPFAIAKQALRVGASVGVSVFPTHGQSAEDLIRQADDAMYAAKRKGKGTFVIAGPGG